MPKIFEANNTADLIKQNINYILMSGDKIFRNVGSWCMKQDETQLIYEHDNVVLVLKDPRKCVTSQHSIAAEIEAEDYLLGLNPGYVHYSPWSFYKQWLRFGHYHYTYGDRGGIYLNSIIQRLKNDDTSRQCIVSLFNTEKDLHETFVPCTLSWTFLIKNNKLNMTSIMRSQDVCRGIFLDTFAYPLIMLDLCSRLDIELGVYTHIIQNSHIYSSDLEFAKRIYKNIEDKGPCMHEYLSDETKKLMQMISYNIFIKKDFEASQKMISMIKEPFWKDWKSNQHIYAYTKATGKTPTCLTCKGLIINTL